MNKPFLLVVLCLSGSLLFGQGVVRLGAAEGLKHPSVYAVEQDQFGFVWLGTREGLYRYNEGVAREVELPSEGFETRNIQSLCVTSDTALWIGFQQKGLARYNLKYMEFDPVSSVPTLPGPATVQALFEDDRGTLWVGTAGQGIYYLPSGASQWKSLQYEFSPESLDFAFDFAQQGDTLFLATSGSQLLYFSLEDSRVHSLGSSNAFESYRKTVDVQGARVVFGIAEQGIWILEQGSLRKLESPVVNPRDVAFNGQEIWVSTDGQGVYALREGAWTRWTKMDPASGVATDQFYSIESIGTSFWIGSFNDGVSQFPKADQAVQRLPNPSHFINNAIQSALCQVFLGTTLWVGFDGDGLVRYEKVNGNWIPTSNQPGARGDYPRVITSLLATQKGTFWVGTFNDGLLELDKNGTILRRFKAFTNFSAGLNNNNIWSLASAGKDSLWVGTLGGLQLFDGASFLQPFDEPWAVGRNIMDLEPQGRNLWIGSEFQGLFKWTLEGLESVDFDYPILDLKAKDSSLYIGSEGGGLFEYNGTTLKRISDASLTCYGIAFQNEFLIVSTNNGLLRGTKQKGIWEFENLLTIDESQLALFNRKALLDWDDQLWLGGPGGVVTVRGELRKPPSRILLTEVFVDNEHLRFNVAFDGKADKIVLKPGSKTIQWGFEIMSLGRASGKRLEYRVEGLIDQWTAAVPGQKGIVLSNLVPGDFNLQMRLINERGSVEDQAVVNWKVRAFFWQERKFKIFVFLLVAVITAFLVAVYQDRKMRAVRVKLLETEKELLEVKAREMEAKAKEKSDELGFQLLKTSSRIQVLQELKDRLQEVRKSYGASSEVGSMLQRLLRDLNSELQSENYWDHFERNYNDLNDAFSKQLTERFPDLTKGETRLTYLIRQKMNNKEISNVLNVSPAAVEKAKYRLKKKLNLSKLDSLDQFIDEL